MNKLLIKKCRIIGADEPGDVCDILISEGRIERVAPEIRTDGTVESWSGKNLLVSPGWFDFGAQGCDPGYEHREDLRTLTAAAAAGGFTGVAVFPNTLPALHSKSEILYVKNKAETLPAGVYPVGALSVNCEGKDLAELFDMHTAGAVAFSDGQTPVQDAGLLLRALQYVKAFGGLVANTPYHKTIAAGGQIHEGRVSTALGLKGVPALAEELMVQRDLSLLEYAESRLHIHLVSTAKSVAMIRKAKAEGLAVTCSAAIANLCFTDEEAARFDSNWKLAPPVRSESDRLALMEAVEDGTIDFICSNHRPWDEESKNLEFPYATFGMNALETVFGLYNTRLSHRLSLQTWIEKIALAPRRLLGLPVPEIREGAPAELTVFSQEEEWKLEETRSKSKNSPFLGGQFKGRVVGTVVKGMYNFSI